MLMMGMESRRISIDDFLRCLLCDLCICGNQWQQTLGQHREVPMHDARLVGPGVAALPINRAEARLRIKMVHKRTGTIVNGFTAQQRVIGVQYAVDKTQHLPVCDQFGETLADAIQQHGRRRAGRRLVELCWIAMSRHHIVDQFGDVITTPSHRKVLDCTDSQVTTGHSGQDGAGLDTIANDGLTGCNCGQSASGGNT